jgi:hypothetical protein
VRHFNLSILAAAALLDGPPIARPRDDLMDDFIGDMKPKSPPTLATADPAIYVSRISYPTAADQDRIAAAEEKRSRKAAKRARIK